MSFYAYRGNPFEYTQENKAFNQLHDLLKDVWGEHDEPLHLLGNFFVDGRDIDALIIKRNAIIVIDFKDYGGVLQFSENGRWRIDGREVRGGSKTNPYHQIRDNKFFLLDYLKREVVFQSSPNLGHISGHCLFHRAIDFDSEQLPGAVSRWFHIGDMEHVVRDVEAIVSNAINLTGDDVHTLLARLNVPAYSPDGQPKVVDLTPEEIESDDKIRWTSEQQSALKQLSVWLSGEEYLVQIIQGAAHTGKRTVLREALRKVVTAGLSPVLIAPNARVANAYKGLGFTDCQSIYSWLYAGRPSEFKNNRSIYPVNMDLPDPYLEVLVFVEAHLLGDEHFSTNTMIYGSGFLLQDLFNVLAGFPIGEKASQEAMPLQQLPKMLLLGDPYQLARGSLKRRFIGGQIFEQRDIGFDCCELQGQIRLDDEQEEKLDFQSVLVKALAATKFVRLPTVRGGPICEIVAGVKTDKIAEELIHWPKQSIMLCATNEQVYKVNRGIRKKYFAAQTMGQLVVGDIVDFHNRTPNLLVNDSIPGEQVWVSSGEFGKVIGAGESFTYRSIALKGRDSEVTLAFAMAKVMLSSGREVEISYLPDYLAAENPELGPDQMIALQIWAREDAESELASEKEELQRLNEQESDNYKEKKSQFDQRLMMLIMASPSFNAARLRYAYALTVHRAQTYLPFSNVILSAGMSHDTENHATASYFRWLYTATVCTADTMQLLNYPILTPLSEAEWKVSGVKVSPLVIKKRFYYDKSRTASGADLAQSIPDGFSNPVPELLALFFTVCERLQESGWEVQSITQNQYCERYLFISEGSKIEIDLRYNGKFEVTVGTSKVLEGSDDHQVGLFDLLRTPPVFIDENISVVVDEFSKLVVSHGWSVAAADEKPHKVFVDLANDKGNIKVEINVPGKGVVSSIKLHQASSQDLVDNFSKEFING
jgi:hypothetical protein